LLAPACRVPTVKIAAAINRPLERPMTDQAEKKSYKPTLNLPKTSFPMKANLVQNEPASMKRWDTQQLYSKLREARKGSPRFAFHDGPPYANGSIHLGHLLNKVLKDFVVRSKSMAGFDVPYIPGWDCHGLPIEHKVMQELGDKARDMVPLQIRKRCEDYAKKFVKLQAGQMQRLLTVADYANPYITMDPAFEREVLHVFADMVGNGLVYRMKKPVHWSIDNQTALAEAELEYYDREDTSVYVMFDVKGASGQGAKGPRAELADASLMIWTTTPWTLPANMAVAVAEKAEYGVYRIGNRKVVIAADLAAKVLKAGGVESHAPLLTLRGSDLIGLEYTHPLVDRVGRVVAADYVTLDDGTGMVHTAPGHGTEDYQTGLREGIDIYCPVRDDGTMDDTVPQWLRGKSVWDANKLVCDHLTQSGHMFHQHQFTHSYPHDWRSKTPVIFRATEQWFVSVEKPFGQAQKNLRQMALEATANETKFIPEWGRNRMRGMLDSRPDWCLSRQRSWGLPIPAFFCANDATCEPLLTQASVRAVAEVIGKQGSDAWFKAEPHELLATWDCAADPDAPQWLKDAAAKGGLASVQLRKAPDIFDVWFESGSSWAAALKRMQGDARADLYLEGSDQHRGWFQVSLLCGLGAAGVPPFKTLLTHGFMVDKDGKKLSKSAGHTIEEMFKEHGTDVLRWWVSSLSTDNDVKVDDSFFKIAGDEYRKVRNTIRFLLSNLSDFDVAKDRYTFTEADATSIDAWAMGELNKLTTSVLADYAAFNFRRVSETLFNFCNETLSAVYLAATKDRLYCDAVGDSRRRRSQTAMYDITDTLLRLLAPFLPHTADEGWTVLRGSDATSVHLALMPELPQIPIHSAWSLIYETLWDFVVGKPEEGGGDLERVRIERELSFLDCGVILHIPAAASNTWSWLNDFNPNEIADFLGVSQFEVFKPNSHVGCLGRVSQFLRQDSELGLTSTYWTSRPNTVTVEIVDLTQTDKDGRERFPRCERSWKRDGTVKQRTDGGMLSDRDAKVLGV
jgi:isoleucyl-tRNA synthetase